MNKKEKFNCKNENMKSERRKKKKGIEERSDQYAKMKGGKRRKD